MDVPRRVDIEPEEDDESPTLYCARLPYWKKVFRWFRSTKDWLTYKLMKEQ